MTEKPTPEQIQQEDGMTRDEAMKWAGKIGPFKLKYWKSENYSGEHREWSEYLDVPQGNPDVAEAAATVIQQAFAERDGEIDMLTEALRGCGRAVEGGAKEPRANVRFIVGETLQALAAKGDSRD